LKARPVCKFLLLIFYHKFVQLTCRAFSDAAASEAADWAIARSLSALKSAEAKGELEKQDSDEGSADSGKSV
jgi:hypothetical protein